MVKVKNKFFKLITSIVLVLTALIFATGCFENSASDETGYSSGGEPPAASDVEGAPPSSGNGSDAEVDEDGNVEAGKIADFSDSFNGYIALVNGDETHMVKTADGKEIPFNDLFERQVSILAEDIAYRLNYIYGELRLNSNGVVYAYKFLTNDVDADEFILQLDIDPSDEVELKDYNAYVCNGNPKLTALITSETILTDGDRSAQSLLSFNIDDINDYQCGIDPTSVNNILHNKLTFRLDGAMTGKNMSIIISEGSDVPEINIDVTDSKKWAVNTEYAIQGKLADKIAQLLTNSETGSVSELAKKANSIGMSPIELIEEGGFADKLVKYINESIIGTDLINADKDRYNYLKSLNNGTVSETEVTHLKGNASLHDNLLYKGYNVTIPQIVIKAINNKFYTCDIDGTELRSGEYSQNNPTLYPAFARTSAIMGTFETNEIDNPRYEDDNGEPEKLQELTTTGLINLNSIILMPKNGAIPSAIVLQLEAKHASENINFLVDFEVNISYVTGGEVYTLPSAQADGEDGPTLTVDSAGYRIMAVDYTDPKFDHTRVNEEGYLDKFKKPTGEAMPYQFMFSLYEIFSKQNIDMPTLGEYDGFDPTKEEFTLWAEKEYFYAVGQAATLNAGNNYIAVSLSNIKVMVKGGDQNAELTEYTGDLSDILFDVSLAPYEY